MKNIRDFILSLLIIISIIEIFLIIIFNNKIGSESSIVYICLLIQVFFLSLRLKEYNIHPLQYVVIGAMIVALVFIVTILVNNIN